MSAPTDVGLEVRTIIVEQLELLRNGYSPRTRKPYKLYKVHAKDLNGDAIANELRTFELMSGTVTVSFDPRTDDDGNVESYTLREVRTATDIRERRREARDALTGRTPARPITPTSEGDEHAALKARVDALEARLEAFIAIFDPDNAA